MTDKERKLLIFLAQLVHASTLDSQHRSVLLKYIEDVQWESRRANPDLAPSQEG